MYKNNDALKIHSQILLDNIDHQILSMLTRIKQKHIFVYMLIYLPYDLFRCHKTFHSILYQAASS